MRIQLSSSETSSFLTLEFFTNNAVGTTNHALYFSSLIRVTRCLHEYKNVDRYPLVFHHCQNVCSLLLVSATKYRAGGSTQNLVELFLFCFNAFNIEGYILDDNSLYILGVHWQVLIHDTSFVVLTSIVVYQVKKFLTLYGAIEG